MKDRKKCKHCDNDNTNLYFCDFCGRPVHEERIEKQMNIPNVIGDFYHPIQDYLGKW